MNLTKTLFTAAFTAAFAVAFLTTPAAAVGVEPHPGWENSLKPAGEPGQTLTLANNGRTAYRIVYPADATTQEEKAVHELATYLGQITGATFPMVSEAELQRNARRVLSIGRTDLLAEAELSEAEADLGDEGYALLQEGDNLFFLGGRRRGPINAVYAFLEEDLGMRWYTIGTTTVPDMPTLKVAPVSRIYTPQFTDRRDPFYSDAHETQFSLHNRTAAHAAAIPQKWGGYPKFPMHFVHTYNLIMPPEEFFEEHPEYYAEIDGQRRDSQLCPTHPEVQRIFAERVLKRLEACPDCTHVDVSPNDWRWYCECPTCSALDEKEGTYAASMLQLVNHVADEVARVRPEVSITTLAYLGTVKAPKTVRPRDNVVMVLCTDAHAWDYIFLAVDETETFMNALKDWSAIDANIKIWDYAIDFFHYIQPLPNLHVLDRNIDIFEEYGVDGVFMQGSHGGNFGVDRSRLRAWALAKKLWDPSLDMEALSRDFYYGFYGKAAEPLYEYDQMLGEMWKEAHAEWKSLHPEAVTPDKDEYGDVFTSKLTILDQDFVDKALPYFERAFELAGDDAELVRRIEYAKLPILYLQAELGPWEDTAAYMIHLNEFERLARRENVRFTKEAYGGPDLDKRLRMWRGMALIQAEEVQSQMLDNEWKFKPDPEVVGVEKGWFKTDYNDSDWGTVRSDLGHRGWESQGYGDNMEGYGWYRQEFEVPENFRDLPNLRLLFGAVDEQAEVWINGQKAYAHTTANTGMSKDFLWNMPFHFDPVAYLKPGKNVVAVRVHNDLHVGGIYKPVWLTWGAQTVRDLWVMDEFLRRRHGVTPTYAWPGGV